MVRFACSRHDTGFDSLRERAIKFAKENAEAALPS
jgi:hypothetical protein